MTAFFHWFEQMGWLTYVIGYVLAGIALSALEYLLSYRLYPTYKRKKYYWNMALAKALHWPAQITIWLSVVFLSAPRVLKSFDIHVTESQFDKVFHLLIAIALLWASIRFINNLEKTFKSRIAKGQGKLTDQTQVIAFAQIARIVCIILFLLVLLPIFGIPTAALLTFGGATTIVLGLATQDSLANLLGGLMIYWDRPFSVGETIRSPDKPIEGTVEDIGWRLTTIRTYEKRPLYVPNRVFSTIAIENVSRMSNRRINHSIGVRYCDSKKLADILREVRAMLDSHPDIDQEQTTIVSFDEFAESSLNFMLRAFTKTIDWAEFKSVQQDVLLKTHAIIEQHGAQCAFPTRTLEIPEGVNVTK